MEGQNYFNYVWKQNVLHAATGNCVSKEKTLTLTKMNMFSRGRKSLNLHTEVFKNTSSLRVN